MECTNYINKPKKLKCSRYIRMIDSATGKVKPHGWCGHYQCVHNPLYMARYDMYYNEELEEEEKLMQQRTMEAVAAQEPIPEPPSMTLDELNTPSAPAQKYANPADILRAVGIRQGKEKEIIPLTSEVDELQPELQNLKAIEDEKEEMFKEINNQSDIRMILHILNDAEQKGYVEVALKAQKKINSLSNLQNLRK